MKTVIIGLGNPILMDDGVGPRVAEELKLRLNGSDVTVTEASVGGLALVDLLAGFDQAIIVDAIQTVGGSPGQIYRMSQESFADTRHTASPHDVNFATALDFAARVGVPLPEQIDIFAVEAVNVSTFSEDCTPEVERAIPVCVEMIIRELNLLNLH